MTEIVHTSVEVQERDGILVVDSRLIADRLGIEHESFLKTIDKHKASIQEAFGVFRFEIGKPPLGSKGGRPEKYAFLTEEQATALMTLSRNTPQVVELKIALVQAFSTARRAMQSLAGALTPKAVEDIVLAIMEPRIKEVSMIISEVLLNALHEKNDALQERIDDNHKTVLGYIGDLHQSLAAVSYEIENRTALLPAGRTALSIIPNDYISVREFSMKYDLNLNRAASQDLGKRATRHCKEHGIKFYKTPIRYAEYGSVHVYLESVLLNLYTEP